LRCRLEAIPAPTSTNSKGTLLEWRSPNADKYLSADWDFIELEAFQYYGVYTLDEWLNAPPWQIGKLIAHFCEKNARSSYDMRDTAEENKKAATKRTPSWAGVPEGQIQIRSPFHQGGGKKD
jgi:hypothetical protein